MGMTKIRRKARWLASRIVSRIGQLWNRLFQQDEVDIALSGIPGAISQSDLKGQVVVVTGSTRGIGLVIAKAMAQAGARVTVNGRQPEAVHAAVQAVRDLGGEVIGVCADIATEVGAERLLQDSVKAFGRLDVLINNAAILGPTNRPAWDISPTEWQQVLAVNLGGVFLCARRAAQLMVQMGIAGRIINVSSEGAKALIPGMAPYIVSKAALEAFTRGMALDAGRNGLTVTGIELGSYQTSMSRTFFSWDEFQVLPPPEAAVPIFLYTATAPRELVHGRILAASRFAKDPQAEQALTGPLAAVERWVFPAPKHAGHEIARSDPRIVMLDRAENTFGMPGNVRSLLERAGQDFDFARYPDENYPALRKALSDRLQLPPESFTFGNGSVDLVERALRTFVQPGEAVISNEPTWFVFDRFCNMLGIINRKIPFKQTGDSFDHNLDAVVRAIGVDTRLIYLVNPSNPLGVGIAAERFRGFLDRVPPHIPIMVDEAYLDFSTNPGTVHSHGVVLRTDRRVIGVRTFSKFYGLAALRIGYAFAAPDTLRLFNRLEQLFCLSSLAEAAAVAALGDAEHAARTRGNVEQERKRIELRLSAAGLGWIPSEANFMLVECPCAPEKVYQAFEQHGIHLSKGGWGRFIHFPVVHPSQNTRNLDILCSL